MFKRTTERKYTHELLFSTLVDLMRLVVLDQRNSVHRSCLSMSDEVGVSVRAVYDKLARTEADVSEGAVKTVAAAPRSAADDLALYFSQRRTRTRTSERDSILRDSCGSRANIVAGAGVGVMQSRRSTPWPGRDVRKSARVATMVQLWEACVFSGETASQRVRQNSVSESEAKQL